MNTSRSLIFMPLFCLGATLAGLAGSVLLLSSMPAQAAACRPDFVDPVLTAPAGKTAAIEINCDLTLPKGSVLSARLAFSGAAASGVTLDCQGGTIDGRGLRGRTILIRSVERAGRWDVPTGITIRNCTVKGDLRIQGLGSNGQGAEVKRSSRQGGHTERAQAAAPRDVLVENVSLEAQGGIPFYLAPGVTHVTLRNSRFSGRSTATFVYLDAESAGNTITGNLFAGRSDRREVIAIDGSAGNRIENNTLVDAVTGGIFLYRNCGEGGTVRHQNPQENVIRGNLFRYTHAAAKPAVWIGSRQGLSIYNSYCLVQPDMLLGGIFHADGADNNMVVDNRFEGGDAKLIVDEGSGNRVANNR